MARNDSSSRREFVRSLGVAAALGFAGSDRSLSGAEPAADAKGRHLIRGIDRKNLLDDYLRRDLDAVSDSNLAQQAAEIISVPVKGGGSFTLHAPLELLARVGLLAEVDPRERQLARLQLIASAASFESNANMGAPKKVAAFPDAATAQAEFSKAFQGRDGEALEAIMLQYAAQFGIANLVQVLTPLALPTLTGASHSHIGLWLLLRHGRPSNTADPALLRAAARSLAAAPKDQLRSFKGMAIDGGKPLKQSAAEIEQEITKKLKDAPRKTTAGLPGMKGLFNAGEATGNADTLFGDFITHDLSNEQIDAAFRASLRICAHNMLQHKPNFAKFGWSHCLTLPQAAFGLSSFGIVRKLALASTLVWTTAYRSVMSDHALDMAWQPTKLEGSASLIEALKTSPAAAAARVWYADPSEYPDVKQTLATQASIRSDQHLIKYTRACIDMVSFDPEQERLYLAAAAHLCGVWVKDQPEAEIKNALLKGRKTP